MAMTIIDVEAVPTKKTLEIPGNKNKQEWHVSHIIVKRGVLLSGDDINIKQVDLLSPRKRSCFFSLFVEQLKDLHGGNYDNRDYFNGFNVSVRNSEIKYKNIQLENLKTIFEEILNEVFSGLKYKKNN